MTLKRLDDDALVFTTALWTRKAKEIEANPHVALLFHWPSLGRQAHITGEASLAERSLAEELFAERDLLHQLQTVRVAYAVLSRSKRQDRPFGLPFFSLVSLQAAAQRLGRAGIDVCMQEVKEV